MRTRTHLVAGGLAAVVLGSTLSACGDDDQTGGADACALVSDAKAAEAIGVDPATSSDESKDLGGAASNVLSCRYAPDEEGPALVFTASRAPSADKARTDIDTTRRACPDAEPLEISGVDGFVCSTGDLAGGPQAYATWDGFVVDAGLTVSRDGQDDPATVLRPVIQDLKDHLKRTAFEFEGQAS
ncbi:MAG: hypothetical protein ABWY58_07110 [Aeromicrobium sp.]